MIEQSFDFAQSVADYFYIMDKGRVVFEGSELVEKEVSQYLAV